MKLTTSLPIAGGLAVGYVLGAAAGRSRYQQIKSTVNDLVRHPKVQQVVSDAANQAKSNAHRLPRPAASFVSIATDRLGDRLTQPADSVGAAFSPADAASQPGAANSAARPPLS